MNNKLIKTVSLLIIIVCFACQKRDDGKLVFKINSYYPLDNLSRIDKNNHSPYLELSNNGTFDLDTVGKIGACVTLAGAADMHLNDLMFYNYKDAYRKTKNYTISYWFRIIDYNIGINGSGLLLSSIYFESPNGNYGVAIGQDLGVGINKYDSLTFSSFDGNIPVAQRSLKNIYFNVEIWNNIVVSVLSVNRKRSISLL